MDQTDQMESHGREATVTMRICRLHKLVARLRIAQRKPLTIYYVLNNN